MAILNGNGLVGSGKKYKKLYWCVTHCASYRGITIANSAKDARRYFAKLHNTYIKSVDVDRICRLPDQYQDTIETYPTEDIIKACGGEIVDKHSKKFFIAKRMFKAPLGKIFSFYSKKKKMSHMYQEVNGLYELE